MDNKTNMEEPREEITVCYPEQSFAPFAYNTMKVGAIYYKTFVNYGETLEEAYDRAWSFLEAQARKQFKSVYAAYMERYKITQGMMPMDAPIQKENTPNGIPRDPIAKSVADLVTVKQLAMIRALAKEVNVNFEEECQTIIGCKTDELSKKAASAFIEHLKKKSEEQTLQNLKADDDPYTTF